MRAFCTVSAPLEVCAPPSRPLPPGTRFLALRLLGTPTPRTLYFLVEAKSRVREVYAQTCHHFSKQGMLDTELFGLAVFIDGEYLFADPESKLSKYGPKSWRSSHTHGLDANGKPLLELHFRVQFYIESPLMLRDEVSRHNYYLQLKSNTVNRDIPKECSEQSLLLLGALALQADLGDCMDDQNPEYFRSDDYITANLHTSWGTSALHSCHRENRGMSRADAETHYIREACGLNEVINAHIFRMKSTKNELGIGSVLLSIYAKGIKITMDNATSTTFLWASIGKLSFDRKKFEIRSGDSKIILFSGNDDKNKMILALCRETHQFSMKIAPRLTEAIKREEEESNCLHACYLYSRALNLPYKSKSDQRISVISSTSSNTTSGIVSDRVHSEDELEIMINTPPTLPVAAPSTESLALAHLLDCPSVSRKTSSVGQVSLKDLEDTLTALSIRSNNRSISSESIETKERLVTTDSDSSPNSQHNIGSQCSSTCSTVVVAAEIVTLPSLNPRLGTERRQTSACSSLELGFSHTAQNSTLSEILSTCTDHEFDSNTNEEESNSGMYTLAHPPPTETSGVYTMNSSEMTGESSEIAESESHESLHYGSFHPSKNEIDDEFSESLDSVDGTFRSRLNSDVNEFRTRSDSNISASGSFRGDGSDPTDSKHTLLSAEELTDLIVGRSTYPSRKTVSHTLDSDCDYVTLPLPLDGESYLQGSEDTAPTEDEYDDELLEPTPPTPPIRVESQSARPLSITPFANMHPNSPPPYNAHHETTGLRGPDVINQNNSEAPPPYTQKPSRAAPAIPTVPSVKSKEILPEEVPARFITTRPQINILKAHTSVVGEPPKPSYAAPTINTMNNISQSPLPTASTIGIPIVPYHNIHANHKSMSTLSPSHPPPYLDAKSGPRTCVLLPIIKPRQYHPPPPPSLPRQPPPPPPQLATVYTSQLARSQIELYQQQLYSDVDYVIYPLQDPAISQQDYLDAKQGSILAAMAHSPPPPPYLAYHTIRAHNRSWDACKNHALYRSTPYLSMALSSHSRYASTQNLSDTYVQLPYSPLYSPSVASLCSSCEPPPPPPLRPRPTNTSSNMFVRSRSDDNILNSIDCTPKIRRLPPPPPPPYDLKRPIRKPPLPTPAHSCTEKPPAVPAKSSALKFLQSSVNAKTSTKITNSPHTNELLNTGSVADTTTSLISAAPNLILGALTTTTVTPGQGTGTPNTNPSNVSTIDINTLREKSKHMDLPLISALCNDRSLLKQTKAFVMPKHPRSTLQQCLLQSHNLGTPKCKYPVSGLNTTQLSKPRKTSISHRHPNDKLPPLPVQTGGNNYVMDPTPTSIKHKSFNSQT